MPCKILRDLSLNAGFDMIGQKNAYLAETAPRRDNDQIVESSITESAVQRLRECGREAMLLQLVMIVLWFDGVSQAVSS